MRSFISDFGGLLLIPLTIYLFWGCSTTEVRTKLPLYHPANPEASEAAFVVPPNPFAEEATFFETEAPDGHSGQGESHTSDGMHRKSMDNKEMPHESHTQPVDGGKEMDHKH